MKSQETMRCLLMVVAATVLPCGPVRGQQVRQLFLDDFSDGNAQDGSPIPWWWDPAKGDVAVVKGDLWMRPKVKKPDLLGLAPKDVYKDDMQKYAGDLVVTVQFTTTQSGGSSAGICVRASSLNPYDLRGYVGGIGTHNQLFLIRFDGSIFSMKQLGWRQLPNVDIGSEDVILQFSISDLPTTQGTPSSRLELRAWRPGEEMPAQPQISVIDSQYSEGYAGFYADSGDSAPGIADATVRWIEFVGECSEPAVDFNGDGNIDVNDLLQLIESWGQADPRYDIGPTVFGDGKVDAKDLEVLMSHWGEQVDDPTLVGHWPFDETEGVVANDRVSGSRAMILGSAQWRPQGGRIGGALELNGTTFISAKSPLNPADGPFSVLAWIKGGAPGQTILAQGGGANWLATNAQTGALMTALSRGGPTAGDLSSETVITDGNWHRIAFTWDGLSRRLYVDSVLAAEDAQDRLAGSSANLVIGAGKTMAPGTFWSGLLDDIRIYNRAVKP